MGKPIKEWESAARMIKLTELAQLSGVSKSTIHHYIKMGLLHPPERKGFNQSAYDWTHLNKIIRIRELREKKRLGLSKIKEALQDENAYAVDEDDAEAMIQALKKEKRETRVQKSRMKRIEILDAAIALFTDNGYENTTLEAVAESLDIAKSTIYLYFENKEDLFMDCIERLTIIAVPEREWDAIRKEKDPILRFKKRSMAFQKAFPSFKGILTLTRGVLGGHNQKLAEKAKDTLILMSRPIVKDLRRGIVQGVFRDIDEELFAHMILGMGEGLGCRILMDSRYTVRAAVDSMFDMIYKGIGTQDQGRSAGSSADVTDIEGTKTRVRNIRFAGERYLSATAGLAEVQIDPKKVKEINFTEQGTSFQAGIITKNGEVFTAEINGSTELEGDTALGNFSILVKSIRSLFF